MTPPRTHRTGIRPVARGPIRVAVALALSAALFHRATSAQSRSPSSNTARANALADLRARLDRARNATTLPIRTATGSEDVSTLVGMTRDAIRTALGEPHVCHVRSDVRDGAGHPMMVAPCSAEGEWFYSFYKLPPQSLGGGPELLLSFDAAGACVAARWRFTQ